MAMHKTDNLGKVRMYLAKAIKAKYGTYTKYANKRQVTLSYISNILSGLKSPPDWMLKDFGVKHVVAEHWEITA